MEEPSFMDGNSHYFVVVEDNDKNVPARYNLYYYYTYFTVNTKGLEATRANSPKLYMIVYQQWINSC